MSARPYTREDLDRAYRDLGVGPGRVVYVTSDLGRLMAFEKPGKRAVLEAHYKTLRELTGPEGTIVVPSASMNLCNTDTPFDLEQTPSFNVGVLSEFVRRQEGALRSCHPFVSYTAIGAKAERITRNVSRCAYGVESPMARMLECDTFTLNIGVHPRFSSSALHHVEKVMTVPYRYTKEWLHPVIRNGEAVREPFYMYVWYRDAGFEHGFSERIFQEFGKHHQTNRAAVGRGKVYRGSTSSSPTIRVKPRASSSSR